jgi:hypothetical protein
MHVRDEWVAYIQKERAGFDTLFSKDIFSDWNTYRQPEKKAEDSLRYALDLRYGKDETGLADKFLERCLVVAERVLAEQRFDAGIIQNDGPSMARANALEMRALANALLGKGLDVSALCDAATDFVTWALHERWDDQSEDAYLHAVRLVLIAGDLSKATELLRIRKRFKWHCDQAIVFRRLVGWTVRPIHDRALLAEFDAVLDPLRPRYPIDQVAYTDISKTRLQLGAIRDKYFISPDGSIEWDRTIEAISR